MPQEGRQAIILFADLVGSARLSDVMEPIEYEEVVGDFQGTAVDVAKKALAVLPRREFDCDVEVRGDQLVFIAVVREKSGGVTKAAKAILELAIDLSIRWFLSGKNQQRIKTCYATSGWGGNTLRKCDFQ